MRRGSGLMEPVGFYASEQHFVDHIAPIWHALTEDEQAWFAVGSAQALRRANEHGIDAQLDRKARRRRIGHVVVAAYNDLRHFARGRVVFVEHGIGQTYPIGEALHSHYSGGKGRGNVDLFICPNGKVATANAQAYPNARSVVVGSPRLDRWANAHILPCPETPTVAISFHFDCKMNAPEARWAFPHFRQAVATLQRDLGWKVLGHGHPRAMSTLRGFYEESGIEVVDRFDEILDRAHIYVADNSSTIFEFAALDRPVVLLNPPWYRTDVEQGLRFWEFADVGMQVWNPSALPAAIVHASADAPDMRTRRRHVSRLLFGDLDGNAASRAAQAMRETLP